MICAVKVIQTHQSLTSYRKNWTDDALAEWNDTQITIVNFFLCFNMIENRTFVFIDKFKWILLIQSHCNHENKSNSFNWPRSSKSTICNVYLPLHRSSSKFNDTLQCFLANTCCAASFKWTQTSAMMQSSRRSMRRIISSKQRAYMYSFFVGIFSTSEVFCVASFLSTLLASFGVNLTYVNECDNFL